MIAKGVAAAKGEQPPPELEEVGETGLSLTTPLGEIIAYALQQEIDVDPLTMTKAEILEAIEEREIDVLVGDFIVGEQVRIPKVEDRESFEESLDSIARRDVKMMAELLGYGYKGNWKPDQITKVMAGEGDDWKEVGAVAEIVGGDEAYISFGRTPEMGFSPSTGKYFVISESAVHEKSAIARQEKEEGLIDEGNARILYDPTGVPRYANKVYGIQDGTNWRLVWELGDEASPADIQKPATIRYTEPGFGSLIKQVNPDGMEFTQEELDQMKEQAEAGEEVEVPAKPIRDVPVPSPTPARPVETKVVTETVTRPRSGLDPDEARKAGREVFFAMMKHSKPELTQVWNQIPAIERNRFKRMADGQEKMDQSFYLGIAHKLAESTMRPEVRSKAEQFLYETEVVEKEIKVGGTPKKREFRPTVAKPTVVRKEGEETKQAVAEEAIAILKKEAEEGKKKRATTTKRGKPKKKPGAFPARPPPKKARPPRAPPAPKSGEKKQALLDF